MEVIWVYSTFKCNGASLSNTKLLQCLNYYIVGISIIYHNRHAFTVEIERASAFESTKFPRMSMFNNTKVVIKMS